MLYRLSLGVVALLASSALTQVSTAYAQETQTPEASADTGAQEDIARQDTIVIRGQFIPDEKRETAEVASLLDAEDFALRGDSDVASALRRATGVSIADGKFVIIRGLNERYASSTLNGSILPSPEPLRKVTPLDLFPTSVLESTLVQKTFSPNFSAEFGGGTVDIRTKKVPLENFFEVGLSTGGDNQTNLQDGFLYDGGDNDFLGFDDGTRDLPAGLEEVFNDGTYASSDRNAFSQALTTDPSLLVVQEGYVGPDMGIDATIGRRYDVNNDVSIGFLGTLAYSNEWQTKEGQQGIGSSSFVDPENPTPVRSLSNFQVRSTTNTIGLNGLASVGLDLFDAHSVNFLAFGTRSTDKEAEVQLGRTNDNTGLRRDSIEWIERQLWTTQIQGEHTFDALLGLEVDWRASYSEAERDAPFQFRTQYQADEDTGEYELFNDNSVEFSIIEDENTDWGVDATLPLYIGDKEFNILAGYAYTEKDRESQSDFLIIQNFSRDCRTLRIDVAYQCQFADGGGFQNTRSSQAPSFYVATQETDAGYLQLDAQVTNFLRMSVGGRYEDFIQVVQTQTARNTFGLISPPLEQSEFYPAGTLTWNFADDLQLRVGYSETVTRPQFREVGPSRFTNTATNESYIGNPFLKTTDITNFDARLEWYFGRDQFLTLGVFKKELENPIEAFNVGSGESRLVTFINIDAADVEGFEGEYQQTIPVSNWVDWSWFASKDFQLTTNYTYTDSSIEATSPVQILNSSVTANIAANLPENQLLAGSSLQDAVTERTPDFEAGRKLQGQSEHMANLQIGYTDFEANSSLNLLLNFQSERIRSVESFSDESPAIIEQPPMLLDLVYKREFDFVGGKYDFGFKIQNILGESYEAFQEAGGNRIDVDVYDIGTSVSASLSHKF